LERLQNDIRNSIPLTNGKSLLDIESDGTQSTAASVLDGKFEIEYVGMDDSIVAPGRVSIIYGA
jgi:hypothetical protein